MKNRLRIIFTAVLTLSFFVLVIRANPYVKQQLYRASVAEFNASLGDTETQRENISSGNRGIRTIYLDIDEAALYDEETGLFTHVSERDESWIKDGWITIYDQTGKLELSQKVGVELSGNTSRTFDVKSFKIHGNKKYGYTKLKLDLSGGAEPLPGTANPTKYNTIRLRSGSQDMHAGNIRSALVSRLAYESGFSGITTTNRAVVFLNNNYYGIFDIQQNYSNSFLADKFNLKDNDQIQKIKGAEDFFLTEDNLKSLLFADLNVKANREKLEQAVDMDNYLLYYALNVLWNNTDWPQNSFEAWRYTGEQDPENPYSDGRWRFLSFDTDITYSQCREGGYRFFDGCEKDTFVALLTNTARASGSAFSNVIKPQYYQNKFLEIINNLLETSFSAENVSKIIDEESNKIAPLVELYEPQYYEQFFWDNINVIKTAAANRPTEIKQTIKQFGLEITELKPEAPEKVTLPDYSL